MPFKVLLILFIMFCQIDFAESRRRNRRNKPVESESIDNVVQEKRFRLGRRRGRVNNRRSEHSNEIQLGAVRLRGGGCDQSNSSITMSPDKKELSLLFDDFSTEVGGNSGKKKDVRRCRISLPVRVPRGLQVAIVAVDYRGYNLLPQNSKSRLRAAHFFNYRQNGHRVADKIVRKFDFAGALDDEFLVTSEVETGKIWSQCGKNMRMGFVTVLRTKTNRRMEEAMSTVDSMDIVGRRRNGETLKYHLSWQKCEQSRVGQNDQRRPRRRHRWPRRGRGWLVSENLVSPEKIAANWIDQAQNGLKLGGSDIGAEFNDWPEDRDSEPQLIE